MQLMSLTLVCLTVVFSLTSCSAVSFSFQTLRPYIDNSKPELPNAEGVWISSRHLKNPITCPETKNTVFIDVDKDCKVYFLCEAGRTPIQKYCANDLIFDRFSLKCGTSSVCRHKIVFQSSRFRSPYGSISRFFNEGRP